jgi:hypothetical protein
MDTCNHNIMKSLFEQLGLPSESKKIVEFIRLHSLVGDEKIEEAYFWSGAQVAFIKESINKDSEWTTLVDQLDAQLRK